ncbi:Npun_F0296 family exosortase-dependent surface protein [Nostoc sp. UHCC 0870]|uniref:Npun_F0296 family exosortase-dependent surface protein n=1 Tax=Nostoc sp. UHCC 0870 TaxID=2914041 RepID=UPI001EDD49EE|nr:PEP-CTERM sorting domain-containing protein [Nostoc sp. UHCC 0870]UKO99845.1 PEP-CTERM sorting domain-containing protein [Nostoc sp. UHCC 0870]
MLIKKLACAAALSASAIAPLAYAGSAHAVSLTYTAGAYRTPGVTNEGAFSENVNNKNFTTIDFNGVTDKNFQGNDLVKYTFSGGSYATSPGSTGIFNDRWAPAGAGGEVNKSKYLAVFQNNSVSITAKNGGVFNYFGLNAGALSTGNTFELLKGGVTVGKWDYAALNKIATVVGIDMNDQKNGFFEFFSDSALDNFDEIKLSQVGGGGFESDNHTFRIGSGKFNNPQSTPEPGAILGMLAVGGMVLHQRRKQKLQDAK